MWPCLNRDELGVNEDEIERPVEMHNRVLCADRADQSCVAMYTNAAEFQSRTSWEELDKLHCNNVIFHYDLLIYVLELSTIMASGVFR